MCIRSECERVAAWESGQTGLRMFLKKEAILDSENHTLFGYSWLE